MKRRRRDSRSPKVRKVTPCSRPISASVRSLPAESESGRETFLIPIAAMLLLELTQIPLALSLARKLRVRQREREELLRRAIDASEIERRRIARRHSTERA